MSVLQKVTSFNKWYLCSQNSVFGKQLKPKNRGFSKDTFVTIKTIVFYNLRQVPTPPLPIYRTSRGQNYNKFT